jgi:hypothetical protein
MSSTEGSPGDGRAHDDCTGEDKDEELKAGIHLYVKIFLFAVLSFVFIAYSSAVCAIGRTCSFNRLTG